MQRKWYRPVLEKDIDAVNGTFTSHEDRIAAIDEYNKPGSEKFVFLLMLVDWVSI